MSRSASALWIEWTMPELGDEQWEFSHHPDKQDFYRRHGINWEHLATAFARGRLVPWPRGERLEELMVEGAYSSYDDYARYLARAKRGYRRSYTRMEEDLQRNGHLTLPAPIVLACNNQALLFSGYRRLCLAWNHAMVPCAWLVPL